MKRIQQTTLSIPATLMTIVSPVHLSAGEPIDVQWDQICRQADHHEMAITTATGDSVDGYCVMVNADQVSLNVHGRIVRIARDNVARLLLYPPRHQMRSLGEGVRGGLRYGFGALFTPLAVSAVVVIPGTLAWGAVSLPFCALGDLRAKLQGSREVKIK